MSDKTLEEKINLKQLEVNIREALAKEHNWAQQERHWAQQERHWVVNQKHWRIIGWLGFAGIMANFAILVLKHWPK